MCCVFVAAENTSKTETTQYFLFGNCIHTIAGIFDLLYVDELHHSYRTASSLLSETSLLVQYHYHCHCHRKDVYGEEVGQFYSKFECPVEIPRIWTF